jgi:peroxiredoxin
MLLILAGLAAAGEEERPAVVEEFHALVTRKVVPKEQATRNRAVAEWMEKTKDVDLGEWSFLRSIGRYFLRDYETAAAELEAYLKQHGSLPGSDYDRLVGRIFLNHCSIRARKGDVETAGRMLDLALALYPDRGMVYLAAARSLLARGDEAALKMLVDVSRRLVADETIDDETKLATLSRIYATPRARPAERPETLVWLPVKDMDGKPVALEDYRGKVLLVDFWATWCEPCMLEMPNLVETLKEHGDEGFAVIGVSADGPGREEQIRVAAEKHGMTWRQIYDGKDTLPPLVLQNGVRTIPATFLLDRSGKVRYTNVRGPELEKRVVELLAEEGPR